MYQEEVNIISLVNRYRPKTYSEIIGQDHIIESIKAKETLGHMLFIGPAGSGKTSLAFVIAKEFDVPLHETNASDERGIGVVRDEIKRLTRIGGKRIILLDEADNLCLTGDTKIIVGSIDNPSLKRLDEMKLGEVVGISSINPNTLKMEDDKGHLVDSGYTEFYEVVFKNGTIVKASAEHPFFKIKEGRLVEIKLKDLKEGDSVVEVMRKFCHSCPICGKLTKNVLCCSYDCANKFHSKRMSGSGNSMFGKKRPDVAGLKNPMHRPEVKARFLGENNHVHKNIEFVCPKCHNKIHNSISNLYKRWEVLRGTAVHNGIEIVSIKPIGRMKAWNISMERNKNFVLSNGVVTHNTSDAQNALRRIMENPKSEAYFILTGNDGWKIIEPIKSRCSVYEFKRLDEEIILRQIIKICKKEGIVIDNDAKEGLLELLTQANGDMRKGLNLLEKVINKDKKITKKAVLSFKKPKVSGEALRVALGGDFEKAQKIMEDAYIDNRLSPTEIIKELYETIGEVEDKSIKIRLYRELANTERACKTECDPILPLVQLVGFLAFAWLSPHFSVMCPMMEKKEGG